MTSEGSKTSEVSGARGRILYADLLRIVAIATVVVLHVSSGLAAQYGVTRLDWWWIGNVVDSLTRWSVPVFIMLSGMLLLGHGSDMPIGAFLRKRFARVFIPYAVWALAIYVPWKALVERQPFSVTQTISEFLRGSTYYHLWFIYTIMNTYLIAPIVRIIVRNASDAALRYYLWLWFACITLTSLAPRFFGVTLGFSVELANGFVGYFVLGYYFDRVEVSLRFRRAVYALAVICAAVTIWGTASLSASKGSLDDWFYAYVIPTTAVIAAAVFLAFRYAEWPRVLQRPAALAVIGALSAATFGIYFVHPMILWILAGGRLGIVISPTSPISPWLGIPLTSLTTFVLAFVVVQVIRRIPLGKHILP